MYSIWLEINAFLNSLWESWELIAAIPLLIASGWLFIEASSLTGWPPEEKWDTKMHEMYQKSGEDAWRAFGLWLGAVVFSVLVAGILSFTGWGHSDSFWVEMLWIVEYALLWLALLAFIAFAVAKIVKTMVRFS